MQTQLLFAAYWGGGGQHSFAAAENDFGHNFYFKADTDTEK